VSNPMMQLHQGGYKMSKGGSVLMPCVIPANVEFVAVISSSHPVVVRLLTNEEAEEWENSVTDPKHYIGGEGKFHTIISKEKVSRGMFLAIANKNFDAEAAIKYTAHLVLNQ